MNSKLNQLEDHDLKRVYHQQLSAVLKLQFKLQTNLEGILRDKNSQQKQL